MPFALRLLGRMFNDTTTQERMKKEFNPMEVVETPGKLTFSVKVRGEVYTTEELLSMIFEMVKKMSDAYGHTNVRDCVVTIPPSFTRSQRILLMQVAQSAGLNVLGFLHENSAAALYYGIDRTDNETAHLALFYNLGATRVQVSVVRYTANELNVTGVGNKTVEHIEVLSHAWDDNLGGSVFDGLLAEHIAAAFEKQHGVGIRDSKKTMLRVMNHANKAKKVLSANKVAHVFDDSLHQGLGIALAIQRETLDALVAAQAEALLKPIDDALATANVTLEAIDTLELIGGVSRIPKVQELLKAKFFNRDLGMHLNGDEAMAHGAALYAANFSHEVYVKPMWMSEIIPYTIRANFWSPDDPDLHKNATVFKLGTRVNSRKQLTLTYGGQLVCTLLSQYRDHEAVLDEYDISELEEVATNFSQVPLNAFTFGLDPMGLAFLGAVHSEIIVPAEELPPPTQIFDTPEEELDSRKRLAQVKFRPYTIERPHVLSKPEIERIAKKLVEFSGKEKDRQKLSEAKSELEGFIYYMTEKLDEDTYRSVTTESERSQFESLLRSERTWLEGPDFPSADSETLLDRKDALNATVIQSLNREDELKKRETAVEDAKNRLLKLSETAQDYSQTMEWVPEGLREAGSRAVKEAKEWLDGLVEAQKGKPLWEEPVFKVAELDKKLEEVKRTIDLVRTFPRPKSAVRLTQKKEPKKTDGDQKPSDDTSSDGAETLPGAEDPLELPEAHTDL